MLVAQISDTHVTEVGQRAFGSVDSNAGLAAAVAHVNALVPRPDLLLITGDLTNDGRPGQYAALRELLAPLTVPYYVLPGNHDDRALVRSTFSGGGYLPTEGPFLHYVLEGLPLRIIALDTVVDRRPEGTLCPRRLGWLTKRLAEAPDRPTLIAMHHPPTESGLEYMDTMRCSHYGVLGTLARRYSAIKGIVCGHLHRPVTLGWQGTVVQVCPSTAFHVGLALGPNGPGFATDEPPAMALHWWMPGVGLASHLSYIGAYKVTPFT